MPSSWANPLKQQSAKQYIEKGLRKRNFALATFIDIASAFDRLDPDAAIKAMTDKNISPSIIKWYGFYLKNRVSDVN